MTQEQTSMPTEVEKRYKEPPRTSLLGLPPQGELIYYKYPAPLSGNRLDAPQPETTTLPPPTLDIHAMLKSYDLRTYAEGWEGRSPESKRFWEFVDSCLRINTLVDALPDYRLTREASALYLLVQNGWIDTTIAAQSLGGDMQWDVPQANSALASILTERIVNDDTSRLEQIMRENPNSASYAMMFLIAEQMTRMRSPVEGRDEQEWAFFNNMVTKAIHDFSCVERLPVQHFPGGESERAIYARLLCLLRDSHYRFNEPYLMHFTNQAVGEVTGISDYGPRTYRLSFELQREPGVWADLAKLPVTSWGRQAAGRKESHGDGAVLESSSKGLWKIVQNFCTLPEMRSRIEELAKKYDIAHVSPVYPPQYLYILSNATVYAEQLDTLMEKHGGEADVQGLLEQLRAYVQQVPDLARIRVTVGGQSWGEACAILNQEKHARLSIYTTSRGGASIGWEVPLHDVQAFLMERREVSGPPPEAVDALYQCFQQMPQTADSATFPERLLAFMQTWQRIHEGGDQLPFTALFYRAPALGLRSAEAQVIPAELSVANSLTRKHYLNRDPTVETT